MKSFKTMLGAIENAKLEYLQWELNFYGTTEKRLPQQFNIQIFEDSDGERLYGAEFMENEGLWHEGTLWCSGDEAVTVFKDPKSFKLDISLWQDDWTEKV